MLMKVNLAGMAQDKPDTTTDDRLGCYRLWARPKTPRRAVRGRPGHMIFGPYPLGTRR
jgi:hypothetical protein